MLNSQPEARLKILVVEDFADARLLLVYTYQEVGIEVLQAENGLVAVAKALKFLPDLILMDLSMPVLDGFEATRQIKANEATRHIPVVALSAHCDDPVMRARAVEAGCLQCLNKPVYRQDLLDLLRLV